MHVQKAAWCEGGWACTERMGLAPGAKRVHSSSKLNSTTNTGPMLKSSQHCIVVSFGQMRSFLPASLLRGEWLTKPMYYKAQRGNRWNCLWIISQLFRQTWQEATFEQLEKPCQQICQLCDLVILRPMRVTDNVKLYFNFYKVCINNILITSLFSGMQLCGHARVC